MTGMVSSFLRAKSACLAMKWGIEQLSKPRADDMGGRERERE